MRHYRIPIHYSAMTSNTASRQPNDDLLKQDWIIESWDPAGSAFALAGAEKLHEAQSPFQKVEVYRSEHWGNVMLIDGCYMVTSKDNFVYHEMMAHAALYSHAKPKDVVIIGGGDCGTLREVLKHATVGSATQIDIDKEVTIAAEKFFPELCESNSDPRAKLLWIDGIKWMAEAGDGSADIIIIDSTDPVGPGEGLFTRDFYQQCFRVLREGGIIVQQSESPLVHLELIKEIRQAWRDVGFSCDITEQFFLPSYPTGWWSASLACKGQNNWQPKRDCDVTTQYYNSGIHNGAFAQPQFLIDALGNS